MRRLYKISPTTQLNLLRHPKKLSKRLLVKHWIVITVCCELLSASVADALRFVNMVCLPLIAEQNAHEICLTQECLQIIRHLLWKQITSHSEHNNNPIFD